MSDNEGSEGSEKGPLPQEVMHMLFNENDFKTNVLEDKENLCCVLITSTLCTFSGVGKLKYPKIKGANDAEEEAEEEPEDEEQEDTEEMFFAQFKKHLVENPDTTFQRRHVRFFHVCACTKEETNIAPLVASDPTFSVTGRQPNEQEVASLQSKAYQQLTSLLHTLAVRSTPQMLFFVTGLPLRYSLILEPSAENKKVLQKCTLDGTTDPVRATGSNLSKWKQVFFNAVVVRNEVLREYDLEVKEKARAARKEQRRLARLERRRKEAEEGENEEEEDDE
ncbi:hypothetical protein AGDE_02569 [Angomonas deanei]|nr:hypothetical protein AGDE_02569 [Angomonas deanei]|eukprot:EPY41356.1 hypothetical protein AGDE_02569 [Angomonas deanei]